MEEINEDHNESLDEFLFNDLPKRETQSIDNYHYRRFVTEQPRLDKSFNKPKAPLSKKECDAVSNSIGGDNLHESYQ